MRFFVHIICICWGGTNPPPSPKKTNRFFLCVLERWIFYCFSLPRIFFLAVSHPGEGIRKHRACCFDMRCYEGTDVAQCTQSKVVFMVPVKGGRDF